MALFEKKLCLDIFPHPTSAADPSDSSSPAGGVCPLTAGRRDKCPPAILSDCRSWYDLMTLLRGFPPEGQSGAWRSAQHLLVSTL